MVMNLHAGIFIRSTDALNDTVFDKAIIFITEYNDKGAMGFIVNRVFSRSFNELEAFSHCRYFPMYEGGPVDQEHLYFIHQRPDLVEDGESIGGGIYLGGNLQQAVQAVNEGSLTGEHLKIFIGYCGWHQGDLEAEIEEGSWELIEGNKELLFGI